MVSQVTTKTAYDLLKGSEGKEHVSKFRADLKTSCYGSAVLRKIVELVARVCSFGRDDLKTVYTNYITALNKDQLPTKTHEKVQQLAKQILAGGDKAICLTSITTGNNYLGKLDPNIKYQNATVPVQIATVATEKSMGELSDLVVELKSTFEDKFTLKEFHEAISTILQKQGIQDEVFSGVSGVHGLSSFMIESAAKEFAKSHVSNLTLNGVNEFVEQMKESFGKKPTDKDHCEVKAWQSLIQHLNITNIQDYANKFSPEAAETAKQAAKAEVGQDIAGMIDQIGQVDKDVKDGWIALQRAKATFILDIQKHLTGDKDGRLSKGEETAVKLVLTDNTAAEGAEKMLDDIMKREAFGAIVIHINQDTIRDVNFEEIQNQKIVNLTAISDAKKAYEGSLATLRSLKGKDQKGGKVSNVGFAAGSKLDELVKAQKQAGEEIPAEYAKVRKSFDELLAKITKWSNAIGAAEVPTSGSLATIIKTEADKP